MFDVSHMGEFTIKGPQAIAFVTYVTSNDVAALAGVREFPTRVKCASLAWHTLMAALSGAQDPAKTE